MSNTERLCLGCMSDNGGERICPICGYDNNTLNPTDCLPAKFIVKNKYMLGKVTARDGEGITYIAWDKTTSAKVTVKEYFPEGFAHRNPDKTVSIAENGKYIFNEGLLEFMEINGAIMASSLPALIEVKDVFEENGTAYAVKEFFSGITLSEFLDKNGGMLKWEQARPLFLPVIDTIGGMNEMGYIHGGISTETIIVGRTGKLRIDGYSIRNLRHTDSELKYTVYSGFAACEQYDFENMHIDTYTDVYGLCATLFRVLIGNIPPAATVRLKDDVMTIPSKFAEELPRQVLAALANGLQVLPENRTRDIESLKNELVYGEIAEPELPKKDISEQGDYENRKKGSASTGKYIAVSAICTVLVFALIVLILLFTVLKDRVFKNSNSQSAASNVSIEAPVVESVGTVDSEAEINVKLYPVPDFKSKYYSEIYDEDDYEMFDITVKGKEYSNTYPKGTVCRQSVEAGKEVERDTKIELFISLGPQEIKIANLSGLDEVHAKLELLKQGFLYENIKVLEKYDEDAKPGVVIEQIPKYGEKVNPDTTVEIYINSYRPEDE